MTTATTKRRRAADRAPRADQSLPLRLARALLRGVLCALVCVFLLSLLAAAIAQTASDPDRLLLPLGLGVLALACLVGGLVTRRASRLAPLLCGALSGLSLLALGFVLSWLLPTSLRGSLPGAIAWGLRGGVLIFSLLGASMGATMPKKRHRPSRRK